MFATLVLALATAWMAMKTGAVALATQAAAEQSKAEAAATRDSVDELQKDRELAWRPYLVIAVTSTSSGPDGIAATLDIENVGRGPALDCVHAFISNGRWSRSSLFAVTPGSRAADIRSYSKEPPIFGALFTFDQDDIDNVHVVVCHDAFGDKLYRFVGGRTGFEVWRRDTPRPAWAEAAGLIEPQLSV